MHEWIHDPFFWTSVSLFGLCASMAFVDGLLRNRRIFGLLLPAVFIVGRVTLVLPFCPQPRVDTGTTGQLLGGALLVLGLAVEYGPCLKGVSEYLVAPHPDLPLRTTGLYALTRNPIYLGENLWFAGLALVFGSILGLALVPVFWVGLLMHVSIEERSMEAALGDAYRAYKRKVRGRFLPWLPF